MAKAAITPGTAESVAAASAVRFAAPAAEALARDERRIVIVGAGGWIGRSALEMLHAALGAEEFSRRVVCFGSSARDLSLADGSLVAQAPLAQLAALPPRPSLVLHLAFLTKDKVAGMAEADFIAGNRQISDLVVDSLDRIGADRLFVASSGAAAFAEDPVAAADLRLYGRLKRDDENRFAAWAGTAPGRRAAIGRLYAVSGPFINKPETYALADFILAALANRPVVVRAPVPVYRSYVAVRELVSLVFADLLACEAPAVLRFDTGGEPLELGALADKVADVLGGRAERASIGEGPANRYVGDHGNWLQLLADHALDHVPIERQIAETAAWLSATITLSGDA